MSGLDWLDVVRHDLRYAWRGLRRAPGFALTVVITLALGLGLNSALFSVIDRIFLRAPAGVTAPRELRRLYFQEPPVRELRALPGGNSARPVTSYAHYTAMRSAIADDAMIAAYAGPDSVDVDVGAGSAPALASFVTQSYFPTLGIRPSLGRFFAVGEDRVELASPVAVISDALWHRRFGGDSAVIGQRVTVASVQCTIVGVAPPRFAGVDLDRVDIWRPLGAFSFMLMHGMPWYASGVSVLRVVARVRDATGVRRLSATATVAYRRAIDGSGSADTASVVIPGSIIAAMGPGDRPHEITISMRLAGVALIVLLIACGNVANLLLVRATRRQREIAVRRALGVSQARLCVQLITESVLLSSLAAAAALLVGTWSATALRTLLLPAVHWSDDGSGFRVVAFTVIASVITGVLAGLAPALHAAKPNLTAALKADTRTGGYRRSWVRNSLLIGQAALTVVLLVGAGLFARSLTNVRAIDIGFDTHGLVTVRPMFRSLDDPRRAQAEPALSIVAAQLGALPGVASVAMASGAPLQGAYMNPIFVGGRDSTPRLDGVPPFVILVSPQYLRTLGMRVIAGRFFDGSDRLGTAPSAVISTSMAGAVWPGENPLGKCILVIERTAPCRRVIGVVDDTRVIDITEKPVMQVYLPLAQVDSVLGARIVNRSGRVLLIRTRPGSEAAVMRFARATAHRALPGLDELRVSSMPQVLEPQLRPWRLGATLFTLMGVLAVIVATIGVYSVTSYAVSQRTHEMGLRIALGAQLADILRLVVGEGLRILAIGIAIGVSLAFVLGRFVASLLYGLSAHDTLVFSSAAALLALVGTVANFGPALRVARIDPGRALRAE